MSKEKGSTRKNTGKDRERKNEWKGQAYRTLSLFEDNKIFKMFQVFVSEVATW